MPLLSHLATCGPFPGRLCCRASYEQASFQVYTRAESQKVFQTHFTVVSIVSVSEKDFLKDVELYKDLHIFM